MSHNQAWQITAPNSLNLVDLGPLPQPGPREALIRIHAASLNYRDKLVLEHSPNYPSKAKPGLVPCCDGAGIVEQVGSDSIWKKGDHVILQVDQWLTGSDPRDFDVNKVLGGGEVDGTLRRYAVVKDKLMFRAPENLSLDEASTLYCAGGSAYRALFYYGVNVGPGTTVLTQGTGGVSCWAMLIAAAAGATVISTSSSSSKLQTAREVGATPLINYRTHPDWSSEVLKATNGKGVDVVVEVVGAQSIEQTIRCTAYGGTIGVVGLLSEDPNLKVDVMTGILIGAKTVRGLMGAGSQEMAREFVEFIEKYDLHPPIAEMFEFEEAEKAFEALANLSAPGKVVVRC